MSKKKKANKKQKPRKIGPVFGTIIPKVGSVRLPKAPKGGGGKSGPAGVQTPTPSMRDVQRSTDRYIRKIAKQQRKAEKRYLRKLGKQEMGFAGQLEMQAGMLDAQLNSLASQSAGQEQYYSSLLGLITSQQEAELSAMRQRYERQNRQSKRNISRLQQDIERLSLISTPPDIQVDTRPGVVGFSQAQQASLGRQRLGLIGTKKLAPQRTSALGLNVAA